MHLSVQYDESFTASEPPPRSGRGRPYRRSRGVHARTTKSAATWVRSSRFRAIPRSSQWRFRQDWLRLLRPQVDPTAILAGLASFAPSSTSAVTPFWQVASSENLPGDSASVYFVYCIHLYIISGDPSSLGPPDLDPPRPAPTDSAPPSFTTRPADHTAGAGTYRSRYSVPPFSRCQITTRILCATATSAFFRPSRFAHRR